MSRHRAGSRREARKAERRAEPAAPSSTWPALTGLRGLAALAVFALHAYVLAGQPPIEAWAAWLFRMGGMGVDVFFVLSAFLLTLPYLRAAQAGEPPPDWRGYARRRFARIAPAYYVQMALLLGLGLLGVGGTLGWRPASITDVVAHGLFWINAWPLVPAHLPPWWTLPTELSFYLVLPALALWLRPGRRRRRWLLVLIGLSLASRWVMTHADLPRPHLVYWIDQLPGRLHQFVVGMLAAEWYLRRCSEGRPAIAHADAVAGVAMAAFLAMPAWGFVGAQGAYTGGPTPFAYLLPWHLLTALIVAVLIVSLAERPAWATALFAGSPLRFLGSISYSLYLWHFPVLVAVRDAMGGITVARKDFLTFVVYGAVMSVMVAFVSWWLVERPAQAWGHRVRLSP